MVIISPSKNLQLWSWSLLYKTSPVRPVLSNLPNYLIWFDLIRSSLPKSEFSNCLVEKSPNTDLHLLAKTIASYPPHFIRGSHPTSSGICFLSLWLSTEHKSRSSHHIAQECKERSHDRDEVGSCCQLVEIETHPWEEPPTKYDQWVPRWPPYCAETPLLSIRVMIECDFSMYLPVFLQSFVDLVQRQAMVVYRDVEMCAGVVAQT